MKRWITVCCITVLCVGVIGLGLTGCQQKEPAKIGISFGVGEAARWPKEADYMEAKAKALGVEVEVRLNKTDTPKTMQEDCIEMIDSGIDVLVVTPRNVREMSEVVDYAKKKDVKVISYARAIMGETIDLYVGYDTYKMGQDMGQHLSEKVYEGDYIILKGDKDDFNTPLLYNGAMKYLEPMIGNGVNVILDDYVAGWSYDEAKRMVKEAVQGNGNKINAILSPNDGLAGAAAAALEELNITEAVIITGMDAELDAIHRIVNDKQDMTIYMNLQKMAEIAIEEAVALANGEEPQLNGEIENESGAPIPAYLVSGQIITKQNIEKTLIDTKIFTKEEIYAK